jgi:hypothetical protein
MALYFAAVKENKDGSPSRVEHGRSGSELVASRAALRLANTEKCSALVVERSDKNTEHERVTQRIQYYGKTAGLAIAALEKPHNIGGNVVDPRD